MFEEKETASAGNTGGGKVTAASTSFFTEHNTTERKKIQAVLAILPIGEDHALTAVELARLLDVSPRSITAAIEKLRRDGHPICASCYTPMGYYIAETREELRRYLMRLNRRISNVQRTRDALAAQAGPMEGR